MIKATRMEAMRIAAMVDRLPQKIDDPETPGLLQQAALECFFVHVRTLIEFLRVVQPKYGHRDRTACDALDDANWKPDLRDDALAARLDKHWETASKHVVHFSKQRVFNDREQAASPSTGPFVRATAEAMADDVLKVWDQYAKKCDHPFAPLRENFTLWR